MDNSHGIKGTDELLKKLPPEYRHWNKFGCIKKFIFERTYNYESSEEIGIIEMILTDINEKYKIKMRLENVSGTVGFDILNGFYSGFSIEDLASCGYERSRRFKIASFEQDIDLELFCEEIYAALIE